MPTAKELEPDVVSSIADVCSHVANEPLYFFSEADLQARLYTELLSRHPKLYPTSVPINTNPKSPAVYSTPLIHREYGAGNGRRIDLSVFTDKEVKKITNNNLCENTDVGSGYIKPSFSIELGTEKSGDTLTHLENDILKLEERSKCRGYLIHIFRDTCAVPQNTLSYQRRQSRIIKPFQQAIEWGHESAPPKVTIIGLLLELGRRDKATGPRCQLYAPNGTWKKRRKVKDTKHWYRINLKEIKSEVIHHCNSCASSSAHKSP